MIQFYQDLCNQFIRPHRQTYQIYDLGNPIIQKIGRRFDFDLYNSKNLKIKCSYYKPYNYTSQCVVYLHSFNGSRLQGCSYAEFFLRNNIAFSILDFGGSGRSEGQYVSLGCNQKDDAIALLEYIHIHYEICRFSLWGRSMGAVTALKCIEALKQYKTQEWKIQSLILDSPFSSINRLAIQIAHKKINLPLILLKAAFLIIKNSIENKIKINFDDLQVIKFVHKITIPVLILTSKDDHLINHKHSEQIYQKYGGEKQLIFISGDHNQYRDQTTFCTIMKFIKKRFDINLKKKERIKNQYHSEKKRNTNLFSSAFKIKANLFQKYQNPQADFISSYLKSRVKSTEKSELIKSNYSYKSGKEQPNLNPKYHMNIIQSKLQNMKRKSKIAKIEKLQLQIPNEILDKKLDSTMNIESPLFNSQYLQSKITKIKSITKFSLRESISQKIKPIVHLKTQMIESNTIDDRCSFFYQR